MDWLPEALKDYHQRSFPWQGEAPPRGVLHTTEGGSWPTYGGWTIMPHATVLPTAGKGVVVRQHLPFSQGSFALVHASGQTPTNGLHAFQFELIGTSEKGGPGYYWPDADDAVLLDLYKKVIKPLDDAFHIPFKAASFLPYPQSYGNTSVRMAGSEWTSFSGWCGHQHVPENLHGDPGHFPWDRLVKVADVVPPKPKPPTPPTVTTIHGPLLYGSTGRDVTALQHRLNKQLGVDIAEDGDFGRATRREVLDWQKKHSLTQDGVVGPNTAKSMGFAYRAK